MLIRSPEDRRCAGVGKPENDQVASRKLKIVSVACILFITAQVVGGIYSNSLAIISDAAHMLSDLVGFVVSLIALNLARRRPTDVLTFGFHRAEVLGALANCFIIWVITIYLVYEAIERVRHPEEVDGRLMFIIASTGLVFNIFSGYILIRSGHGHSHGLGESHSHSHGHGHGSCSGGGGSKGKSKRGGLLSRALGSHRDEEGEGEGEEGGEYRRVTDEEEEAGHGHSHAHAHGQIQAGDGDGDGSSRRTENIGVTAAFVHVLGDAVQTVGVMVAAALIWYDPEWKLADPICTFLFSILVLFTTFRLTRQVTRILMEGFPESLSPGEIERTLMDIPGVREVHDLHVWTLSVGKFALSAHLVVAPSASGVLAAATTALKTQNIRHATLQLEHEDDQLECNPMVAAAPAGPPHLTVAIPMPTASHGHSHGGGGFEPHSAPAAAAAASATTPRSAARRMAAGASSRASVRARTGDGEEGTTSILLTDMSPRGAAAAAARLHTSGPLLHSNSGQQAKPHEHEQEHEHEDII